MSQQSRPVALITGSATGVGRACALRFAQQGYDVVVNYSRSKSEAEQTVREVAAAGAQSLLCCCDVADDAAVRDMLEQVESKFGRLDVLVNNAATTSFVELDDLEGLTESMWDRMLAVNLKGAFFVTRAANRLLQQGEGGSVVNVSSVAGLRGRGSSVAYAASKGGLNTMTKSLAIALAPQVRVNAVLDRSTVAGFAKAIPTGTSMKWLPTCLCPARANRTISPTPCCTSRSAPA